MVPLRPQTEESSPKRNISKVIFILGLIHGPPSCSSSSSHDEVSDSEIQYGNTSPSFILMFLSSNK